MRPRVLMLGWEYPPHISGGLGTACEGLTRALSTLDIDIDFVVPALYGVERAPHMRLLSPTRGGRALVIASPAVTPNEGTQNESAAEPVEIETERRLVETEITHHEGAVTPVRIPAQLSPYLGPHEYESWRQTLAPGESVDIKEWLLRERRRVAGQPNELELAGATPDIEEQHYGNDLFGEVHRYAARVLDWVLHQRKKPQVVHAHDWMTFPAAIQVAKALGIPMIAHVHSLEQDRSGEGANPTIVAIEGHGLLAAKRVIAVSHYTSRLIQRVHGVPAERIDVVHNGVYARRTVNAYRHEYGNGNGNGAAGPIVLFLGRITYQKGPDYFVEAAAKVLEKVPNARFVMAGAGDMLPRMKARVDELGIGRAFVFPGFVRGADVESLFSVADCYVMPSVSEPFGISALEAMSYETPVILSRQSGASEVLRHTLKVDFWDISRLASQIVACLVYPELRRSIVDMAKEEVRRVHWDASAQKVRGVYERALAGG